MATDATGAPTPLGIPKYNTSADAPSGLGFNAAMDALDALIAAKVGKPAGISANEAVIWDGSAFVRSSVSTVRINNGGSQLPKVTTSTLAGGPPGSPSDGDIWIATAVDANGVRWAFQYNAGSGSASKWEFIGGSAAIVRTTAGTVKANNANFENPSGISFTAARAGDYIAKISGRFNNTSGTNTPLDFNVAAGAVSPTEFSTQNTFAATQASFAREDRLLAVTAATAIQPRYREGTPITGGSLDFEVLTVIPIRVA